MNASKHSIPPDLAFRIQQIEFQLGHRVWMRAWLRFALTTVLLTAAFTGALALRGEIGLGRGPLLAGYALTETLAAVGWFLWGWRRLPTLGQVALYIDEHYPDLENRIVTAVEFGSGGDEKGASSWLIEEFLRETRAFTRSATFGDLIDGARLVRGLLGVTALLLLAVGQIGVFRGLWIPELKFRRGAAPPSSPEELFSVEPGDARVRRGDNQVVLVKSELTGRRVEIRWRSGESGWQGAAMDQGSSAQVHYHAFNNIQQDIEYEVQFGRRRSPVYRLMTWVPPEIVSIDLTYHYPEYLGLPSRHVPNSGNITAVEGSLVELEVQANKKLVSAELVLEGGDRIRLAPSMEAVWTGRLEVLRNDKYHIELMDDEGQASQYNPVYDITAQPDRPPEIKIDFPRGDSEVTSLEEVPFEFRVSDDFGLRGYGLQYEVVGHADPVRIELGAESEEQSASRGAHQLMLESLALEPGDLITWTVWAQDGRPGREAFEEMGDPYFLEIRPFARWYEEAVSNAMQGMQGMAGGGQGGPAADQKDIIVATWNLRRRARGMNEAQYKEERGTIVEAQLNLLQQVRENSNALQTPEGDFKKLVDAMAGAVEALSAAELPEPTARLSEATVREQTAYRLLLKLRPDRSQVQQRQGGQGGGGAGGANRERPEIDELELRRNTNFFEEERRTQMQQQAAEGALSKIKELAQRQRMFNEEIAKLISEIQQARTEREREELERRLERLQDEARRNLERLDQVQRDVASGEMESRQARQTMDGLQDARDQMNRSLENLQNDEMQQARSAGSRALAALSEIEQSLESFSRAAAEEKMRQLLEDMERLEEREASILAQVEALRERHESPLLSAAGAMEEEKKAILDEKSEMTRGFTDLMEKAGELAERAAASQELMSRKLGDWLRQTSKDGLLEDVRQSEPLVNYGIWKSAEEQERQIQRKLADAAERLEEVASQSVTDDLDALRRALDELERIVEEERETRRDVAQAEASARRPDQGTPAGTPEENEERTRAGQSQPGAEESSEARPAGPGRRESATDREERQSAERDAEGQSAPNERSQPGSQQREGGGSRAGSETADRRPAEPGPRFDRTERQAERPAPSGGPTDGAWTRGGAWDRWAGGWWPRPEDLRRFIETDYERWIERIRNAEALLPPESDYRRQLERVRRQIEEMRRDYRRHSLAPRFELFLQEIANPLAETAQQLDLEIQKLLAQEEFLLTDEGTIPAQYRKRVAEYFQALSEAERMP